MSKFILEKISAVGANETIAESAIREFCAKNPLVEIGVGVSPESCKIGSARYKWLMSLLKSIPHNEKRNCRIALHVNRAWAREIAETGELPDAIDNLVRSAKGTISIQLNVVGSGYNFEGIDPEKLCNTINWFGEEDSVRFVLPYNEKGADFVKEIEKTACRSFDVLYDASFGKGDETDNFLPAFPGCITGYAGGLGAENVAAALDKIKAAQTGTAQIYVDAQGKLRADDGSGTLDLEKAQRYVDAAMAWRAKNAETEQTHDQN